MLIVREKENVNLLKMQVLTQNKSTFSFSSFTASFSLLQPVYTSIYILLDSRNRCINSDLFLFWWVLDSVKPALCYLFLLITVWTEFLHAVEGQRVLALMFNVSHLCLLMIKGFHWLIFNIYWWSPICMVFLSRIWSG